MKVTDLMINDLVYYIDGEQPIPVVVKMIDGKCDVVCLRQSDGHLFHATIDSLLPIPLTKEILEKNGFKFDGVAALCRKHVLIFYGDKKHDWEVNIDRDDLEPYGKSVSIHVKYVHELQHALYICGIEKEITIKED